MATGLQRSKYEAKISTAARALYWAGEAAAACGDPGAEEDCIAIRDELSRLLEDSIRGRKRPVRQLTVLDS